MSSADKIKGVTQLDNKRIVPEIHWEIEPNFGRLDSLPELPGPRSSLVQLSRRKRFIACVKRNFIWIMYMTMVVQMGANIGVLTAVPGILTSEVLYFRIPLTRHVINSQAIPMLAPCVINHLVIGEWYFVSRRYHLQEGDMLGILGLLLLYVTAVSIDACRLIQSHVRLVDLRRQDGTGDHDYTRQCYQTYLGLIQKMDHISLAPTQYLVENYQCCSKKKSLKESLKLFSTLALNYTKENVTTAGFQCCRSDCLCDTPSSNSQYTICLTKLLEEMSRVYSSTYPIYIVFILASLSSILAFLYYNSQMSPEIAYWQPN